MMVAGGLPMIFGKKKETAESKVARAMGKAAGKAAAAVGLAAAAVVGATEVAKRRGK
jgi:hypothetical protein